MKSQIEDLVRMNDIQTLFELMTEDDDWIIQLDAAEGLIKLGDVRGLEFLRSAQHSEDSEIREVAREILASPAVEARRGVLEADLEHERRLKRQAAVKRLQAGRKVFQYKMVFLPATDILDEDVMGEGFDVPALTDYGLEGWEVVNMIPRRRQMLVNVVDDNMSGAYFLLKRELSPSDTAELQ
jgi:hypothetical protein